VQVSAHATAARFCGRRSRRAFPAGWKHLERQPAFLMVGPDAVSRAEVTGSSQYHHDLKLIRELLTHLHCNATLVALLEQTRVWTHAFVVGELACGNLAQRVEVLTSLAALPHAPLAGHDEVLTLLETHRLMGRGLGWVGVHLLASAKLAKVPFWTLDKRLAAVATALQLQG
jgi:hypothetical protein